MKLRNLSILSAVSLVALLTIPAFAQDTANNSDGGTPRVIVNSSRVRFEGQTPIEQQGHLLVPLRGILEKMGAYVDYDSASQTVVAYEGDKHLSLVIGSQNATMNGRSIPLDIPAQVINGSTMVPLRFVAESLGAIVDFDTSTNTVTINSDLRNNGQAELPPGSDHLWHHGGDNSGHFRPGGFHGVYSGIADQGDNTILISTADGRHVRVPRSVGIFRQGQRIHLEDIRKGDRLNVVIDPDSHLGTRIDID